MKSSLIASLLFIALTSLAYAQDLPSPSVGWSGDAKAECFYNDDVEFVLIGEFGEQARLCFATTYKKGTQVIRVDSEGGQASTGLSLAYRLRDEKFHLIIENKCNSSCALYLIPAANEVSLTKNAGIVLHGSLSDLKLNKKMKQETIQAGLERGQSKSEAKNEYRELKKYTKRQIKASEDHKDVYNIGDGWFMQAGSWSTNADKDPIKEGALNWMQDNKTNGLLVDRLFFETCLPDVKINTFYGPSHSEHLNNPAFQERIKTAKLAVLPNAQCLPQ